MLKELRGKRGGSDREKREREGEGGYGRDRERRENFPVLLFYWPSPAGD